MSEKDVVETKRPYRLWDTKAKEYLPRRCYGVRVNAHKAALWEVQVSKVVYIEVLDISHGDLLLGSYVKKVKHIEIHWRKGEREAMEVNHG